MTPDEVRKTKLGADFFKSQLSGADPYAAPGVDELGQEAPGRLTECFTYLAIAGARTIQQIAGFATVEEVLRLLPPEDTVLIPDNPPNRDAAIALALGGTAAAEHLDLPTAVNSSYGLALSALKELGRRTEEDTLRWAEVLSEGADRETRGPEDQNPSAG